MDKKAVLIASGGIDSSVLCYMLQKKGYEIYPLTFIYGQKHKKEINSAKKICESIGLKTKIIDISSIQELLRGSALTDMEVKIPEVPASEEYYTTLKSTVVPNRNAIFLSIAVGYAQSIGVNSIYFGAHYSDRGIYPDCRKEFVDAFEKAEVLANDNLSLNVEAPFVDMQKSGIVVLGSKLDVPFDMTWSCYAGTDVHCGACSSCRERKRAFSESSVPDPTRYVK